MEEKRKEQIETIKSVLAKNEKALKELKCAQEDLRQAIKSLVGKLEVYEVLCGHSDDVLAASALVGLSQQIEMLL